MRARNAYPEIRQKGDRASLCGHSRTFDPGKAPGRLNEHGLKIAYEDRARLGLGSTLGVGRAGAGR